MTTANPSFRPRLITAAVAAALSAILPAAPVHAQQAPLVKEDGKDARAPQQLQQVEVRGALDAYDPRRDDTASKIVVTHDEIVKYGDTSVLDVLKRVPGVTVSGNGGRGSEVRMRGLGNGYTQILINGDKTPPGFSIDSLAPDLIERIEVLRAASAEFSTQSIAGTINVVLKKTVKPGQRELKLGYSRGDFSNGPNANLQMSDKAGRLAWSLAANVTREHFDRITRNVEEHEGPAGIEDGLRLGSLPESGHLTRINLSPRLIWNLGNGDTLISQTLVNINRFGGELHTLVDTELGPPPAYPDVDETRSSVQKLLRQEVNWTHTTASGGKLDAKLAAVAAANPIDTDRTGAASPGAGPAPSPGVGALHELIRAHNSAHGMSTMGKFTSASWEGHALAFGWDGGYVTSPDSRLDRDDEEPDVPLPGGDQFYTANVTRLALYSQDEWNVTPAWSVYLGARWEGIQTRVEGNDFITVHNRSTVLSPLFQTLYKIPGGKGDQLRFALTRTYRVLAPQMLLPRRFTSVNNSQTDPDSMGNPNLRPELALGVDAAWEHYWAEGALVSVSASARNIDNNTRNQTIFDGSRWVSLPVNTGHARARGLEFETKFPLKAVIGTTTALDLRASLSRNWSSVDVIPGPNNRLMGQTPLAATLGADYKLGAFAGGGSFVFKNGGEVRVSANQTTYESVRRDLDLYALWKFDPRVQLRVAASNLLGQDYISQSSYTLAGEGTQRSRTVYPGKPTVRATLETKF